MNRNLLFAGGLFLIGGGLAYYMLANQNGGGGFRCSNFRTQQTCEANGCYWCNGICKSTPCGEEHECEGPCLYEGQKDCDRYNNLCVCHNGEWELLDLDSPLCHAGEKYYKCLASVNNVTACIETIGPNQDECERPYFSYGCPCYSTLCDDFHICDNRVYRCVERASLNISADNSNWEQCFPTTNLSWCSGLDASGQTCDFDLGKEYGATILTGTFGWQWSLWGSEFRVRIYGYLDGVGWTFLGERYFTSWGSDGEGSISLNFAAQGLSKLRFSCCDDLWINTKPKYFYGSLLYS